MIKIRKITQLEFVSKVNIWPSISSPSSVLILTITPTIHVHVDEEGGEEGGGDEDGGCEEEREEEGESKDEEDGGEESEVEDIQNYN